MNISPLCLAALLTGSFLVKSEQAGAKVITHLTDEGRSTASFDGGINGYRGWMTADAVGYFLVGSSDNPGTHLVSREIDIDGDGSSEIFITGNQQSTFAEFRSAEVAGIVAASSPTNTSVYGWAFARGEVIEESGQLSQSVPGLEWAGPSEDGKRRIPLKSGGNFFGVDQGGYFFWREGAPLFLGLRFNLPDGIHYGWIMFFRSLAGDVLPVGGWAWESEPDKPISAGIELLQPNRIPLAPVPGSLANFSATDTDHSGSLSLAEYIASQPKNSKRTTGVYRFRVIDANDNGEIDYTEYSACRGGNSVFSPPVAMSFVICDPDRNGVIEAGDFPLYYRDVKDPNQHLSILNAFDRQDRTGIPRGAAEHGSLTAVEFGIASARTARAQKLFQAAGGNIDSGINISQFLTTLPQGTPLAAAEDRLRIADIDRNGILDLSEFRAAIDLHVASSRERMFLIGDRNSNQLLDPDEFARTLNPGISQGLVEAMFNRLDRDHDEMLSLAEFLGR